jgi:cephalosporin-C deacetylase-like acetyl esterase
VTIRPGQFFLGVGFVLAALAHAQSLTFTPLHENGIYQIGEKADWTVTAADGGAASSYSYTVKKNNLDLVKVGTFDLSSGRATIEATLGGPGMLYVEVTSAALPMPIHLGAAFAPAELQPAVKRPADFDSFWDGKLAELAKIPMKPALSRVETNQAGVDLSLVLLNSVGSHVQGYLAKPARPGKFPALIIFQWAGVYALQPNAVTDRAAEGWLAFDVDSHDMAPYQASGPSPNYQAIGNTDRETSYFLNMYLRDTRAIDYIASRPDWDGKTLVVMGVSMGGHQSLAAAGLNPKVTAVIVNEPSGADSNGDLHGRKAGYPNWPSNNPKVMQTALYFDTVNFARRIKAPVLAAIGFIDTTCPPAGIWAAVNQIRGPKEVVPMIESDHNNKTPEKQGAYNARSREVLATILAGGEFKPNEELTRRQTK